MLFACAGPLVSAHAPVDTECAVAIASEHDHAAHRLSATPDAPPDHCAACHLTRTARDTGASTVTVKAAAGASTASDVAHDAALRVDLRTDFTRGPPR